MAQRQGRRDAESIREHKKKHGLANDCKPVSFMVDRLASCGRCRSWHSLHIRSRRIDSVLTGKYTAIPAFIGVMALVGYTTKKDLSSMGKILFMALIGIIIATIVNIFLKSSGLEMIVSYLGVLIFVGLTAYDTQKIKNMLLMAPDAGEAAQKMALLGALTLYLDFINLFIYLLRIFGRRE